MERAAGLHTLRSKLNYEFADESLLIRALTHRSWAHENRKRTGSGSPLADNESLEFLGDSILGLAIAETLFGKYPEFTEGKLTLMKHRLVSTATLAEIAGELGISAHLRMGRGEELSGGREKSNIAADALEAVIAAIFLDGGYAAASGFIGSVFADAIQRTTPSGSLDPKTTLQELLQANKEPAPTYNLLQTDGPPHDRSFSVEVVWKGGRAEGKGRSLKAAEMDAAEAALHQIAGE